jgi:hypothetical protein
MLMQHRNTGEINSLTLIWMAYHEWSLPDGLLSNKLSQLEEGGERGEVCHSKLCYCMYCNKSFMQV